MRDNSFKRKKEGNITFEITLRLPEELSKTIEEEFKRLELPEFDFSRILCDLTIPIEKNLERSKLDYKSSLYDATGEKILSGGKKWRRVVILRRNRGNYR